MQEPSAPRLYACFEVDFILIAGKAKRALQTVVVGVKEFVFVVDSAEKSKVLTQSDTWDDWIHPEWSHIMLRHSVCVILCILRRFAVVALDTISIVLATSLKGGKILAQIRLALSPHMNLATLNYFTTVDDFWRLPSPQC